MSYKVASITRLKISNGLKRGYLSPNVSLIVIYELVFAINQIWELFDHFLTKTWVVELNFLN